MDSRNIQMISVSELAFDLQNPRLVEFDLPKSASDKDVLEILWEAMDVHELVLSIHASGFFQHEPLIVTSENGKIVVIEGNRRLAAVKALLDPMTVQAHTNAIPSIDKRARDKLKFLPTIAGTRKDAWRYIGFKHVNGPAKWSSYAKSEYIANVHREFGVPLDEIARQIGDTHRTVQRLFRGMMVIEQAEEMQVFSRADRYRRHFSFSHLYTGLEYPGISQYIGLSPAGDEDPKPVPAENKKQLEELCLWLYGSKKQDKPPVIHSQNPDLRRLDSVVGNREAVAALRSGTELAQAFETSRPSSAVFEESLHAAKRDLEKAHSMSSTGYDGSESLLTVAEDVADLADDLYEQMLRRRGRRRSRRTAGSN